MVYGRFINGETVIFLYKHTILEKTYERHRAVGERDEFKSVNAAERQMETCAEFVEKHFGSLVHFDIFLHEKAVDRVEGDIMAAYDPRHFLRAVAAMSAVHGIEAEDFTAGGDSGAVRITLKFSDIQIILHSPRKTEP